jgi:regulation of enolase protein 1 (concanavalin A-like superfamily)
MLLSLSIEAAPPRLPELRVEGKHMVDPQGRRVELRGVNLGNWLLLEMWMLGIAGREGAPSDQFDLEKTLAERFGEKDAEALMDIYRENWMKERDFKTIQSFRFNLIRLPLNYRMFESDAKPFNLRPDAWKWVDRAVSWAEAHGMYVILDMHGVQGGQSVYDHTGRANQNLLWNSEDNKRRLAWLWTQVAARYKSNPAVVAYDVKNEPYGGSKPQQVEVFKRVYDAIRKVDKDTLIFAHGNWDTFTHYGSPKANGWRNVGYQMHYYPGLFGFGNPTPRTHAVHLRSLREVAKEVDNFNAPFLIGEMNVVFGRAGGAEMMRRYYNYHASQGWWTTMWSYKVLTPEGGMGDDHWGMVTNAQPQNLPNFRTSGREEIAAWFRSFGSMNYVVNEPLRRMLAPAKVELSEMPAFPEPRTSAPQEELPGFMTADLGGAMKGGLKILGDGRFELYGAGEDIWGARDEGRFLYSEVEGDFDVTATVESMEDLEQYSKAGLMIRGSLDVDAPAALITLFGSGEAQSPSRASKGGSMTAPETKTPGFPVDLKLERRGERVTAWFRKPGQDWEKLAVHSVPGLGSKTLAGVVSLSHDPKALIRVTYQNLKVTRTQ